MKAHGNIYSHVEGSMPSSKLVRTIAYRAEPEKYAPKESTRGRPASKYSDELVLSLIRAHRAGQSYHTLAAINDIGVETIKAWCAGTNRGHLLARVEREEQKKAA